MLTPPPDLPDDALVSALARGWAVSVATSEYRPVGFGTHHWEVTDSAGVRWFVNVDDLADRRQSRHESLDAAFGRLRASLAAAVALREHGRGFVVAPRPTRDGAPVLRTRDRFAVAVFPFVAGRSFVWGEPVPPAHRRATLDLVVAVHTAPAAVRRLAMADDFAVPQRDDLDAARGGDRVDENGARVDDRGPYARRTSLLLARHAAPIGRLLTRYDELAAAARAQPSRAVLTHGEPHPGNTMLAPDGWKVIDWDTARVAPPERDLWWFEAGALHAAYTDATGVTPAPALLDLYRLRWDLTDLALTVGRFRRPHPGSPEDDASWDILCRLVDGATR